MSDNKTLDDAAQHLVTAMPVTISPMGSVRPWASNEERVFVRSRSGGVKTWQPPGTPTLGSPRSEGDSSPQPSTSKRCRRSLDVGYVVPSAAGQLPTAGREEPPERSGSDEPFAASAAASTSAAASASAAASRVGTSGTRKCAAAPSLLASSSSKMSVRSLESKTQDQYVADIDLLLNMACSGSELDSDEDVDDDDEVNFTAERSIGSRRLAAEEEEERAFMRLQGNAGPLAVQDEYDMMQDVQDEELIRSLRGNLQGEYEVSVDVEVEEVTPQDVEAETLGSAPVSPRAPRRPGNPDADVFSWSDDFSTFTGQEETYLRTPGSKFSSQDPTYIFLKIWDRPIIEIIVTETNRYAWQTISKLSETGQIPAYLDQWRETTVEEIYILFAVLIYMSLCLRMKISEYWSTGTLGMPAFRKLMSRNRFFMLTKFLHFVNNEDDISGLSSYHKKILKVTPLLNHCNDKFSRLYTPERELSLDESLLLWKGRLPWVQCIRTKEARFGIKSYDLCEGTTGYLLRTLLYAGKESSMHPAVIHGYENVTAKVVIELMDGFLDLGHKLYMDNWYNQLPLSRFLKSRATDVIGTMNRNRAHVPAEITSLNDRMLSRGQQVARHCGDMTLLSWRDVKLVTAISTCHNDQQVPSRRAGQDVMKPLILHDYNKYMGGVDRKDQMLSTYLFERKRKKKWYMKVFHRLLNTSLLNTYILYRRNVTSKRVLTHRGVRFSVAAGLIDRFSCPGPVQTENPPTTTTGAANRLDGHPQHWPTHTDRVDSSTRKTQLRCVRCVELGKRSAVTQICTRCKLPLCLGQCWLEYHTLANLRR